MRAFLGVCVVLLLLSTAIAQRAHASLGDCGQPVTDGDGPSASDALGVLRAAVGTTECEVCVCDVDGNGRVVAADALATLRRAVGQPGGDRCLACLAQALIGPDGGTLLSADGRIAIELSAGALDAPTTVSITGIPASDLPSPASQAEEVFAYRMEPDGLTFDAPAQVTAFFDAVPPLGPQEGVVGAWLPLLLGSDGATLEVLADQALFLDGDANTAEGSASLSHFSQLAVIPTGLGVQWAGIPAGASLNDLVNETVAVISDDDVLTPDSARYVDDDFGAWAPSSLNAIDAELAGDGNGGFEGTFEYTCASVAQTFHSPRLDVTYDIDAPDFQAQDVAHTTLLRVTVDCQP